MALPMHVSPISVYKLWTTKQFLLCSLNYKPLLFWFYFPQYMSDVFFQVTSLSELFRDADMFLAASSEKGFKRNLSNPSLSSNGNSASPAQSKRIQKIRKRSRPEEPGTSVQPCIGCFFFNCSIMWYYMDFKLN